MKFDNNNNELNDHSSFGFAILGFFIPLVGLILEVTVTNKADEQYTYYITIEAVDTNGARIDTDMIYADRMNAGQQIHSTAFEYVEDDD